MWKRRDIALVTVAGCALWVLTRWATGEDLDLPFFGGWAGGSCFALFMHWKAAR